jgi:hypothetical protein
LDERYASQSIQKTEPLLVRSPQLTKLRCFFGKTLKHPAGFLDYRMLNTLQLADSVFFGGLADSARLLEFQLISWYLMIMSDKVPQIQLYFDMFSSGMCS